MGKTLTELPVDLILLILDVPTEIDTAKAMADTCKGIRRIWKENRSVIVTRILRKQVYCYADAKRVQELKLGRDAWTKDPIRFARTLLADHKHANKARRLMNWCLNKPRCTKCGRDRSHVDKMSHSEKERFFHAWYVVQFFMHNDFSQDDDAYYLSLEELLLVAGMLDWIEDTLEEHERWDYGIELAYFEWEVPDRVLADPLEPPWRGINRLLVDEPVNLKDDQRYKASKAWAQEACLNNRVFEPCDLGAGKASDAAIYHVPSQ